MDSYLSVSSLVLNGVKEATLSLKVPDSWMSGLLSNRPFAIRVLDCKLSARKDRMQQLVEVSGPEDDLAGLVEEIRMNPDVQHVGMVKIRMGRMLGMVATNNSIVCRTAMDLDLFCRSCLFSEGSKEDGTMEWTVALEDVECLKLLLDRLQEANVEAKIVRLSEIKDRFTLTPRQEHVIRVALARGYFDYPRKTSLSELAKNLDVKRSTLSEILRRAQRKIIEEYIGLTR